MDFEFNYVRFLSGGMRRYDPGLYWMYPLNGSRTHGDRVKINVIVGNLIGGYVRMASRPILILRNRASGNCLG